MYWKCLPNGIHVSLWTNFSSEILLNDQFLLIFRPTLAQFLYRKFLQKETTWFDFITMRTLHLLPILWKLILHLSRTKNAKQKT